MIYNGVIRNNNQRSSLLEFTKSLRLPFKFHIQDVFPKRSIDYNSYYWGVVLPYIADYTGEADTLNLHEAFKLMFGFKWTYDKNGIWKTKQVGTSEMDSKEFDEFVTKVCAFASVDLGLNIPFPNEVIINENDAF